VVIGILRSLELPLLLGGSVEFSELSDRCDLCDDFGALRLPKKDFDASRVCFESLEGKCWGMAVIPGVKGSVGAV